MTHGPRPSRDTARGPRPTPPRRAGRPPEGRIRPLSDLILWIHLALVGLLALTTLVLFSIPAGNSDCCLPIAVLGVVTLGELVLVLGAIAIAGATGRHGPLAFMDTVVTAPLAGLLPTAFTARSGPEALLAPVVAGVFFVGLASAVLAARVVRGHRTERILLSAGLILLVAFSAAAVWVVVVPLAVVVALWWPHLERFVTSASQRWGAVERPGAAERSGAAPDAGRPPAAPPRRSAALLVGRRGPPDASAVLGPPRPEPSVPGDADAGADPP